MGCGYYSWHSDNKPDDIKDHEAFVECFEAAFIAMDQRLQGNTFHGADHYHTVSVDPAWNKNMKKVAEIGAHIFYRA